MTAISITAPHTTRLRLTTRGRRIVAALAALPAVVALSLAVISGGSALASREASAPSGSFTTLTVAAGESLWSIAEQVAPGADPRDVVDAIVRLNALDGVTVSAGQQLSIPAEYSTAP
ncbi:MAG: LysM peptidoglycan-binding domain-containing protein [Microbacterium sp.]